MNNPIIKPKFVLNDFVKKNMAPQAKQIVEKALEQAAQQQKNISTKSKPTNNTIGE